VPHIPAVFLKQGGLVAEANQTTTVKLRKLPPGRVTLTLKLDISELRVRMAIGVWLIKLGARVIGLGVKVESLGPATEPEVPA